MKVRAKFYCQVAEKKPEFHQTNVSLWAVTTGSEENKSFSKYTPSGQLNLVISDETSAAGFFEQGKEYYLDFSVAE